jgi:hypothetical protein
VTRTDESDNAPETLARTPDIVTGPHDQPGAATPPGHNDTVEVNTHDRAIIHAHHFAATLPQTSSRDNGMWNADQTSGVNEDGTPHPCHPEPQRRIAWR